MRLVAVLGLLLLQVAAVPPAGASEVRIRPFPEPTPMALVTVTGTSSASPRPISLKESGSTFLASGGAEFVLLPSPLANGVSEFHFVCGSSGSITIFPFGSSVIEVGDATTGGGLGAGTGAGGYLTIVGAGRRVTLQSAGSDIWTVAAAAGVLAWGDDYGVAPERVRGHLQRLRQSVVLPALSLSTDASAAAPSPHELGLSFHAGADRDVPALFILPSAWDGGLEVDHDYVTIYLHWTKTTSAAGTVRWQTRYRLANGTRDLSAWSSWTTTSNLASDGNTADRQAIDYSADISVAATSRVPARAVAVQVRREGTDGGDTYGAAAVLLAVDLRFSSDIQGERSDFTK